MEKLNQIFFFLLRLCADFRFIRIAPEHDRLGVIAWLLSLGVTQVQQAFNTLHDLDMYITGQLSYCIVAHHTGGGRFVFDGC